MLGANFCNSYHLLQILQFRNPSLKSSCIVADEALSNQLPCKLVAEAQASVEFHKLSDSFCSFSIRETFLVENDCICEREEIVTSSKRWSHDAAGVNFFPSFI